MFKQIYKGHMVNVSCKQKLAKEMLINHVFRLTQMHIFFLTSFGLSSSLSSIDRLIE